MVKEKVAQAIDILKEKGIDAWLIFARETESTPDPCLELVLGTNCVWQSAFIITAKGDTIAIVGSLDAEKIKETEAYAEVIGYETSLRDPLVKILKRIDPNKIAINHSKNDYMADGLSHGMYQLLIDYLSNTPYVDQLVSSESFVAALRGRKSPAEIERIKGAIKLTQEIFDKVTQWVRPGLSEIQVADFIKREMKEAEVAPAWEEATCPSVFTGPEAVGAHYGPTDRRIQPGHIMIIDFGVKKEGFCSDLQRTWYFLREGESDAPPDVHRAFNTVRDAIQLAAEALRPGVEGHIVDAVARDHITSQGYEEYPHALGHQIGRRAHDGAGLLCPCWERYGNLPYEKVETGQVYTLEPRVTCEGGGVVTIEEIVVVTQDGCEFLSEPQRELICI